MNFQSRNGDKMSSMEIKHINGLLAFLTFLLVVLAPKGVTGQNLNVVNLNVTDLNLTWVGGVRPPSAVDAGSIISAQIRVQLIERDRVEGNFFINETPLSVPASETITAEVQLTDPTGTIIDTHIETFAGLSVSAPPPVLDNSAGSGGASQVSFQIPWSEAAKKTGPNVRWTITASVSGSSLEGRLEDNQVSHQFTINIPNLTVSSVNVFGDSSPIYLPNSNVIVQAVIENNGVVQTPPGSFFGVQAVLVDQAGNEVDTETKILPDSSNDGSTATIDPGPGNSKTIRFNGLRIPRDSVDSNMTVEIRVDERSNIIHEEDETDNFMEQTITLPGAFTPNLTVSENSFRGEVGRFDGLDAINLSFSVRNEGIRVVSAADDLRVRAVLSTDDTYDPSDFILREFNFGGERGELGFDLLPNENIFLNWVQQLPDNFEGDYYVLAVIVDLTRNTNNVYLLDNTPTITLKSENRVSLEQVVSGTNPNERPDASKDGRYVVFEETDLNGIKQIYYRDTVVGGPPVLVSRDNSNDNANLDIGGNQHSLRPKISADGQIITFHSRANNLVPNDKNEHADVFLYKTINGQVIRALNANADEEPNGASLYPDINGNGSRIVFQSRATNLSADGTITSGQQIFLWDTTIGTYGEISAITSGNNDSSSASIDDAGDTILFASHASDLDDFAKADLNEKADVYAHDILLDETWVVSLNPRLEKPGDGASDQPVISGNGEFFVFRSEANDLVRSKGISTIKTISGGLGYFGNPQIEVTDDFGSGEGAILSLENAIDENGQIMPGKIQIVDPGHNYVEPRVRVIPDAQVAPPDAVAEIKAFLANPEGEVYFAQLGAPGEYDVVAGSLVRVSENDLEVGGNEGSKDPHIDYSGSRIVYSTKSSNLLPASVTRSDGTTYLNRLSAMATAKAIVVGGIGEIEVAAAGIGYDNGNLIIADSSGRGFGATASFEVDDLGQISSITVLTPGQDYDLENTTVTVQAPGAGTGFMAGELRFVLESGFGDQRTGGGQIHEIEIIDHGFGYDSDSNNSDLIRIEGDGADLDGDGSPDAVVDPTSFHIDSTTGAVYLIQTFDFELLSRSSLISTELYVEDANNSVTIKFTENEPDTTTVAIGTLTDPVSLDEIRNRIIGRINANWNNPSTISMGPQIDDNITGGNSFTLRAVSGKLSVNNVSSIQISKKSNVLFGGRGFTRATPTISPAPVIFGFSEVLAGTNSELSDSGRPLYKPVEDRFSDDVYLFEVGTGTTTRISRSKFGFPVNYLAESNTTLPSNRFPSLSGNGRFAYFSSDAEGNGSLVFDLSNQMPTDLNQVRDIYHVDLKTTSLGEVGIGVKMLYPSEYANVTFGANSLIPIIAQIDYNGTDISSVELFINNDRNQTVRSLEHFERHLNSNRWTLNHTTSSFPGEYIYQIIVYNDVGEQLGASVPRIIKISEYNSRPPVVDIVDFNISSMSTTSNTQISAQGQDFDGTLVGIQFYIDGVPYGDEILRRPEIAQDLATYSTDLASLSNGVKSIFVIGRDNSGNHVASSIKNISITPGSPAPSISISHGPVQLDLSPTDIGVELDALGAIQSISLAQPMGRDFLGDTSTRIFGIGTGAILEAILDQDTSSPNYGKVTGFEVVSAGLGYDQSISISVIPVIRVVGYGRHAEVDVRETPIYFGLSSVQTGWDYHYFLKQDISGNSLTGYGYAIAPRWQIQRSNGEWFTFKDPTEKNWERLVLAETEFTTGGVEEFVASTTTNMAGRHVDQRLIGGFTQSPCFYEFDVISTNEPISRVEFFVNGELRQDKKSPPYAFTFIADEPGDYSIYASAVDTSGNIATSTANEVKVERYKESGVTTGLSMDSNFSIAADTKTILTAGAASEFGVAEIEFYINEISYSKVLGDGRLEAFIGSVDLGKLNQGQHSLTVVARDFAGNYAGTFSSEITTIETRQDEIFTITSKLPTSQPPTVDLLYPPVLKRMTNSSTIYLQATAFDVDGRLEGVQFYINGETHGNEIPHDRTKTQIGYPFGISWSPTDEGVYLINAVARDSSGNKTLSGTSTVTVTLGDNLVPAVSLTPLNNVYESNQSIFLSAQISDEANSSTGLGVIEDVQFFANGAVIRDFNNTGPFFDVWNPDPGVYEVFAMAVDNEGNHAISDINTVFVGVLEDFDEQPKLGGTIDPSLDDLTPELPLKIKLSRRAGRRTAEGVVSITSIAGLPQSTLNDIARDQRIKFSNGSQTSAEYTVSEITDDGALEVFGDVSPADEAILISATQIELIPIFTAGSSIYLSLSPDVDDSSFESVSFYVDGTVEEIDNAWPFSMIFSPTQKGTYTISVVAENQFQNKTLYSERIIIEEARKNVPTGPVNILPLVHQLGSNAFAITPESEISLYAAFTDIDNDISRVEFYLNGKLDSVDYDEPFYHKFAPNSDSTNPVERGFEIVAVGIDKWGNRYTQNFEGFIGGSSIPPTTTVKSPSHLEEYADGQSIEVKIEVSGSIIPRLLGIDATLQDLNSPNVAQTRRPREMAIMANGQYVGLAGETEWGSGVFVGEWTADLDFAQEDGTVELFGTMLAERAVVNFTNLGSIGYSPTTFSNVVRIIVSEPNVASDPQSAINQAFNDLLGFNPTQEEVATSLTTEMNDGGYLFDNIHFLEWAADLSDRNSFQNMVDAIGGYHIMTGIWPLSTKVDEILTQYTGRPNNNSDGTGDADNDGFSLRQEVRFKTDPLDGTSFPPEAFNVAAFVDETLDSADYTSIHPPMTRLVPIDGEIGGEGKYIARRYDFVKIIFQNKYGRLPTYAQQKQGSFRIAAFDPNSPEAQFARQKQQFEELQRYAALGLFSTGNNGNGQNGGGTSIIIDDDYTIDIDDFKNKGGMPAALFVTNMISEQLIENRPLLDGAPNKRDYYETAALIVGYWGDNLESLTDEIIDKFHSLSTEDKISKLMKDPRYFNRFGGYSISRQATEVSTAPGWKWLDWFGHFNDDNFPWIYHFSLGWLYVYGPTDEQVSFYSASTGWLGTTKEIWEDMSGESMYLWLYDHQRANWVAFYLQKTSKATFWDPVTQKYFTYE